MLNFLNLFYDSVVTPIRSYKLFLWGRGWWSPITYEKVRINGFCAEKPEIISEPVYSRFLTRAFPRHRDPKQWIRLNIWLVSRSTPTEWQDHGDQKYKQPRKYKNWSRENFPKEIKNQGRIRTRNENLGNLLFCKRLTANNTQEP